MIIIDENYCKGCRLCGVYCPTGVLTDSDQINKKGYYPPKVDKAEECHGCRLCELLCPEFAIFIRNE
jgi:2-oxoglutarate ferredoxin oxidoreductase subunit delta